MLTVVDPDRYVSVAESHTCPFHRREPGTSFAGCTCRHSFGSRLASPEEYLRNRRNRLVQRRLALKEELDRIDDELGPTDKDVADGQQEHAG